MTGSSADALPSDSTFKQHMRSRSRGGFRPGFASGLTPSLGGGRREDRAPAGTHEPLCKVRRAFAHRGDTGAAEMPGLPCAVVGTAYVVLSSGSEALLPPSPFGFRCDQPGRADRTTARLDVSLRTPEPHDLAVRDIRLRPEGLRRILGVRIVHAPPDRSRRLPALQPSARRRVASTAPHPAIRDDRVSPLRRDELGL